MENNPTVVHEANIDSFQTMDPKIDFMLSEPINYTLRREDGTFIDKKCPKPKSAGFVIMSLILGMFQINSVIIFLE